jgi:hypothetical protein
MPCCVLRMLIDIKTKYPSRSTVDGLCSRAFIWNVVKQLLWICNDFYEAYFNTAFASEHDNTIFWKYTPFTVDFHRPGSL